MSGENRTRGIASEHSPRMAYSPLRSCFRPVAEVVESSSIPIFAAILALVLAAVSHKRHIFIAPAIVQAPVLAVRGGALFRPRRVQRTVDVGLVVSV